MEVKPVGKFKTPVSSTNLFIKAIDLLVSKDLAEENRDGDIVQILKYLEEEKRLGSTKLVPIKKLIKLLDAVVGSMHTQTSLPKQNSHSIWDVFDTIAGNADACRIALLVMTSPDVPKQIFMESYIEHVLLFLKYQLRNTVCPHFIESNKGKNTQNNQLNTNMVLLLDKLTKLVCLLTELLDVHVLTEALIEHVLSMCVSCLHVSNAHVRSLQLECLKIATKLFTRYEKHRKLLLNEILSSTKNVSDTKRLFKADEERSLQMFSAYMLQLIQCIAIPRSLMKENARQPNKQSLKIICKTYQEVSSLAGNLLSLFFAHCYKDVVFETFVDDLLSIVLLPSWPAAYSFLTTFRIILTRIVCDSKADIGIKVHSLEFVTTIAIRLKQNFEDEKSLQIAEMEQAVRKSVVRNVDSKQNFLHQALLDFLAVGGQTDEAMEFSRQFYLSRWCETTQASLETPPSKKKDMENFLLANVKPFNKTYCLTLDGATYQPYLDSANASLIAKHFLSKQIDETIGESLKTILVGLQDAVVLVRTKALKCLVRIIETDSSLLSSSQIKLAISSSFRDNSIPMREAALDLTGKLILSREDYVNDYYQVVSSRILDTGVSVRKKTIKLFHQICVKYPDFEHVTQIYVSVLKRIGDEESVKKLVVEVFESLWFQPTEDALVLPKVTTIVNVFRAFKGIDFILFKTLLTELSKSKNLKSLLTSYQQIVNTLLENLLTSEVDRAVNSTVLYAFVKARPIVLMQHLNLLRPYLTSLANCNQTDNAPTITNVVKIMKLTIPLVNHLKHDFLSELETELLKMIDQRERSVVESCFSCLNVLVNKFTRNYACIRDCFHKYQCYILDANSLPAESRQLLRRAIFVVGLLLKYFDIDNDSKERVLTAFFKFLHGTDSDLQLNTLKIMRCVCFKDPSLLLHDDLQQFYCQTLASRSASVNLKSIVLVNIEQFLYKEDKKMSKQSFNFKEASLKEMNDVASSMSSTIIQKYLPEILTSYLDRNIEIRQPATKIIQLVLQQGLVQPSQIIPYLICMSSDSDKILSDSASNYLAYLEFKYPGSVYTKAYVGITLSYELQKILQNKTIIRGFTASHQDPSSINECVFSVIKTAKHRRALLVSILKQFENPPHVDPYLLFLADNLAYFPYSGLDEIVFIISSINSIVSLSGLNVLKAFENCLNEMEGDEHILEDDDEVDAKLLISRIPEDATPLQTCLQGADPCLLLLLVKQHLKATYGLTDSKIQHFNSMMNQEPVTKFSKVITCKNKIVFEPTEIIKKLTEEMKVVSGDDEKEKLVCRYLEFRKMMFDVDRDESPKSRRCSKTPKKAQKRRSSVATPRKSKKKKVDLSDSDDESD